MVVIAVSNGGNVSKSNGYMDKIDKVKDMQ